MPILKMQRGDRKSLEQSQKHKLLKIHWSIQLRKRLKECHQRLQVFMKGI